MNDKEIDWDHLAYLVDRDARVAANEENGRLDRGEDILIGSDPISNYILPIAIDPNDPTLFGNSLDIRISDRRVTTPQPVIDDKDRGLEDVGDFSAPTLIMGTNAYDPEMVAIFGPKRGSRIIHIYLNRSDLNGQELIKLKLLEALYLEKDGPKYDQGKYNIVGEFLRITRLVSEYSVFNETFRNKLDPKDRKALNGEERVPESLKIQRALGKYLVQKQPLKIIRIGNGIDDIKRDEVYLVVSQGPSYHIGPRQFGSPGDVVEKAIQAFVEKYNLVYQRKDV